MTGSMSVMMVFFAWSLPVSLFGMQAGVIAGSVMVLGWGLATRFADFQKSPLDLSFITLLAAVGLSLLLVPDGPESFRSATSFWVWAAFFVVFHGVTTERSLRLSVNGLLILSVLVAAFGVYQSYSGHYPLGETIHSQATVLLKPAFGEADRYCAVGLFSSRVTFANMLLFPFCWLGALLLEKYSLKVRLLLLAGAALLWIAMNCTWTRAAPLAAILAAVGLVWTRIRRGRTRLIVTAVVLVAIVGAAVVLAPGLLARAKQTFSGKRDWGRLTIWHTALDMASMRPATGFGYGNFERAAAPLIDAKVAEMKEKRFAGQLTWAHNDLLTFLAECGIFGAFAYCWLFVAYFLAGGRVLKKIPPENRWLRGFLRGSMTGVLAFLVTCVFHDNFFHGELAFILFFTMGASLAVARTLKPVAEP
jgi:O-antigen ligase